MRNENMEIVLRVCGMHMLSSVVYIEKNEFVESIKLAVTGSQLHMLSIKHYT